MRWKRVILLAFIACALGVARGEQRTEKPTAKEQLSFSAEDEAVDRPVGVPEGVLEILRKDERVLRYLKADGKSVRDLTAAPFLASEIHLNGRNETDLIVIGTGRLRGANVTPFWVFRRLANRYELVLNVPAHDLRVESGRWHGFRNISVGVATASVGTIELYRFDRNEYDLVHTKSESIP